MGMPLSTGEQVAIMIVTFALVMIFAARILTRMR